MTDRPISRRLRYEILRRDNHTCRYCGTSAPDAPLTVDHVIPRALGGGDDPTNLVTACRDCNAGKSSTSPDSTLVADVDAAALLFASAVERAAATRRADRDRIASIVEAFDKTWTKWGWDGEDGTRVTIDRDRGWQQSISRFVELGLDLSDLEQFTVIAMRSRVRNSEIWKFFCGCCWRELSDRQEDARRLIEDGKV